MRAFIFLAVAGISAGAAAQEPSEARAEQKGAAPAPSLRERVEAHLKAVSQSAVELASLGRPVKAETCRIFDRGQGLWRSLYTTGVAVHVRYRTRDRFGAPVVHSKVLFVDADGKVLSAVESGGVRSRDPALLQ